ncbi:MAG: hypothetical protein WCO35_01755 [Candidatus Nomurabacteria bacterium]
MSTWYLSTFLKSTPEGEKLNKKYGAYVSWYHKGWFFKILLRIPIYYVLCDIFELLKKQNPLCALDDLHWKAQSFGFDKLANRIYDCKSMASLDAGE